MIQISHGCLKALLYPYVMAGRTDAQTMVAMEEDDAEKFGYHSQLSLRSRGASLFLCNSRQNRNQGACGNGEGAQMLPVATTTV